MQDVKRRVWVQKRVGRLEQEERERERKKINNSRHKALLWPGLTGGVVPLLIPSVQACGVCSMCLELLSVRNHLIKRSSGRALGIEMWRGPAKREGRSDDRLCNPYRGGIRP